MRRSAKGVFLDVAAKKAFPRSFRSP